MKSSSETVEPDEIDLQIIEILQEQGRIALVKLGEHVGLSAPSAIERVKKLEDGGIITGYHASVDARLLGKDVAAFIGVSISDPRTISQFEETVEQLDDVLECHHVTGQHTLLLKVKTRNTASLEELIKTIRMINGVSHTETMVVLSTHTERAQIVVTNRNRHSHEAGNGKRHRHASVKSASPEAKRA
ncbi:MAG TPA: Lrp/AsnC family transcriptional regulator [Candidatus Binataceae bacterium]|nr:Lrp/AsnC family transcriptional regulator [Candidatus Binataceae bacterium]